MPQVLLHIIFDQKIYINLPIKHVALFSLRNTAKIKIMLLSLCFHYNYIKSL